MFDFIPQNNKFLLEEPLRKIGSLITQRENTESTFYNMPFDVFEKIAGNVLFDFLDFEDGENLIPKKRWELFLENTKKYTIAKDFTSLCQSNKIYEIALLLDRDPQDYIRTYDDTAIYDIGREVDKYPLSWEASIQSNFDVLKLLLQKNRRFDKGTVYAVMPFFDHEETEDQYLTKKDKKRREDFPERYKYKSPNDVCDVLSFLYKHRKRIFTTNQFEKALSQNDFKIIRWFLEKTDGKLQNQCLALDDMFAIASGEIIQGDILYEEHRNILRYIYKNHNTIHDDDDDDGYTSRANETLDMEVRSWNNFTAVFLIDEIGIKPDTRTLKATLESGNHEFFLWLIKNNHVPKKDMDTRVERKYGKFLEYDKSLWEKFYKNV